MLKLRLYSDQFDISQLTNNFGSCLNVGDVCEYECLLFTVLSNLTETSNNKRPHLREFKIKHHKDFHSVRELDRNY